MSCRTVAVPILGALALGLLIGCTNVAQMRQAYEAGDETQLTKLLDIAATANYPYATRKEAVKALGAIGDPAAVPVLVGILREYDRRTTLKEEALVSLGRIGDPETAEPIGFLLDRSLSAPNDELRLAALTVLGQLGGEKSADVLINALQYYDMLMVRADQSRLRGVFSGDESVIRSMRDSVRTPGGERPVVGMFPGESASSPSFFGPEMDRLPEKVNDSTPREREMAHESLVRVGVEAIPVIHRFLSSTDMTLTLREELDTIVERIREQGS